MCEVCKNECFSRVETDGVEVKLLKASSVPHTPDHLWSCDRKKPFCPGCCAQVEKWRPAPWARWAKHCVICGRLSRWWNSAAMDLINTGGSWQDGVGLETSCWSSSGSCCSVGVTENAARSSDQTVNQLFTGTNLEKTGSRTCKLLTHAGSRTCERLSVNAAFKNKKLSEQG